MGNKSVNQLYENAWQFMKAQKRDILYLEDQVYMSLLSALYEKVKNNPLYCDDIVMICTERFLNDDLEKAKIDKNRGEKLIQNIIETLGLNKRRIIY